MLKKKQNKKSVLKKIENVRKCNGEPIGADISWVYIYDVLTSNADKVVELLLARRFKEGDTTESLQYILYFHI